MGLSSILNTGTRALMAAQIGMDVTGQNISNADVEGYSRKRLNQAADYRYDSTFGQMGFGVTVINIERQRDQYIDLQIQRQNQQLGFYQQVDYVLERVENIFTEPSNSGLLRFIDQFFDSWQNLTNNPADLSARTMVKTNAEILTNVFGNIAGELNDLKNSLNSDLEDRVRKVNQLAHAIYNINQEIATVEVNNQHANDSRDRRDVLVKELATLVDIQTNENQFGQISISTGGSLLVSPVFVQTVETTTSSYRQSDGSTLVSIGLRFAQSRRDFRPTAGELAGIMDARDRVVPQFQRELDTLAVELATQINDQHRQGYNLLGYSGLYFFDPSLTGASDIALSASILSNVQNIAAASGGAAQAAANNTFAAGTLDFGLPAVALTTNNILPATPANMARNIVAGTVVVNASGTLLTEGTDYHIDYVRGTIQMLHGGYTGEPVSVDFEYRTGSFKGPGDNTNALAIARLRSTLTMVPDTVGNKTSTFAEYYSSFIGRLGLNRTEATSNVETRRYLIEQFNTHQDAIAGVSLDEEMANLIRFQHAFTAAARLIGTASQMMDVLFNM